MFYLSCTSDKIWNLTELISYLVSKQSQDVEIDLHPEAIALENLGFYDILDQFDFASVTINTWNPLEHHKKYIIKYKGESYCLKNTPEISKSNFLNTHAFLCFFHRPTAARLGLASHLYKHHHDNSIIHFSANTDPDSRVHFELDKLLSWDIQSVADAGELLLKLPILQASAERYTKFDGYDYSDPLTDLYQNIFVDVVVENHVAGLTFFPTEKICRPIVLGRPFIVFGSKNYLLYMRQMGFQTFWKYWNEDYDSYDGTDRLTKIYQVFKYIGSLPSLERGQLYEEIKPIIDHNRNLLISQKWNNKIKLVDE